MDDLKLLDGRILVDRCSAGDTIAWHEFVRRYTPLLKKAIINTLLHWNRFDLASDADIIMEVYVLVLEKLRTHSFPHLPEDPEAIGRWLWRAASNRTLDWLGKHYSQKNMPKRQATESLVSFEEPVNTAGNRTHKDIIADENESGSEARIELAQVFSDMENLNQQELWALRLKMLFYNPLDEKDVHGLALFTKRPGKDVSAAVKDLMDRLLDRQSQKNADLDSAGRIWSVIRHLETRLMNDLKKGDLSDNEFRIRQAEIEKKARRMEILRNSGNHLVSPTNEEIAAILGIPPESVGRISVLIHRARAKLESQREERRS
jgi:RNA polymerase sigma factor (sigma-70 family)